MISILVDYNLEGQAAMLSGTYDLEGWAALVPIQFVRFRDVNLPADSSDRVV